jgi:hypothetical protein
MGAGYNLKQGAIQNPEGKGLENSDFLRNRLIAALIFSNPTPSARPIYSVDSFECSVVDVGNFRDYISNIKIDGVGLETLDFLKEK